MVRRQLHPNWTAIYDHQEAVGEEERAMRQALFVGHGEDAIPAGRRLIEEIFLAALPIGAGRAVFGPPVESDLERFLGVSPAAFAVELMGLFEQIQAAAHFVRGAVNGVFSRAAENSVYGTPEEVRTRLDLFQQARELYRKRRWEDAQKSFQTILDSWPEDGPSRAYWKRCQEYLFDEPPSGWDGVFTMTHK